MLCHLTTVFNIIPRKTKIEGDGPDAGPDDAEIGNQPIDGVHHEMDDFIALFYSFLEENVCESVHLLIQLLPCDLASLMLAGYSFNQGHIVWIESCISCQHFSNMNI